MARHVGVIVRLCVGLLASSSVNFSVSKSKMGVYLNLVILEKKSGG